jgi:phenylacetate-CoA ligase
MNVTRGMVELGYSILNAVSPYKAWGYYTLLSKNQYLPEKELLELQWIRFRRIIRHAYENVPFYHRKFREAGIHPDHIKTPDRVQDIPFTTRSELSETFPVGVIARGYGRKDLVTLQTSGTQHGIPFRLFIDKDGLNRKYALLLRNYSLFDWHFGKKIMALWNKSHEDYRKLSKRSLKKAFVYRFVHRKRQLPPFQKGSRLDGGEGRDYFQRIRKFRPHLIEADAFMLYHMGKHFVENGLVPPPIEAISSATCPTTPLIRKRISQMWKTGVFNNYGPHEMEGIACECSQHKGLHQSIDAYLIEFIDGDSPAALDRLSEVVLTDLDNYAMPLIRYRIGDVVRAGTGSCTCGRTLPLMNDIEGRAADLIRTPNGVFSENALQDYFAKFGLECQFRIIQSLEQEFDVDLIPPRDCTPAFLQSLEAGLRHLLGEHLVLRLHTTDAIPCEASGKFRPVMSKLGGPGR